MGNYRAYIVGNDNHFRRAHVIDAPTDEKALELARQYVDGCDVELWDGERKIAKLTNKNK